MVDWDGEVHSEIDQLMAERNSAKAEAALWLRRLQTAQQERDQARRDLAACDKSHSEWEAAYADLLREYRRLELKMSNMTWERDGAEDMLRHYRNILGMVARGEWHIPIDPELYSEPQRGAA